MTRMNEKITAVLVDTSAYERYQHDFAGINNAVIPMFLELLQDNDIILLTHSILDGELRKHIKASSLVTRVPSLIEQIKRCKKQLELVDISVEDWLATIEEIGTEDRLLSSYLKYYSKARALNFGDPEKVFRDYFETKPPFHDTGKKKSEFPDAFVLKGLSEYCMDNPDSTVLIVSRDSDWAETTRELSNTIQVDSISDALRKLWTQLDDKWAYIESVLQILMPEIKEKIEAIATSEAYSIPGIDNIEDLEIYSVRMADTAEEITPLEIEKDKAILQVMTVLYVDGQAQYLDEERSIWDSEDGYYILPAYTLAKFRNATTCISYEVEINYSLEDEKRCSVSDIRMVYNWDIELFFDDKNTEYSDISNDNDFYDPLEGYGSNGIIQD